MNAAYRAFHNYSIGNQLLAAMQLRAKGLPLTPIASFNAWKDKGRFVKKGQRAISLFMPVSVKRKEGVGGHCAHGLPLAGGGSALRVVLTHEERAAGGTQGRARRPQPVGSRRRAQGTGENVGEAFTLGAHRLGAMRRPRDGPRRDPPPADQERKRQASPAHGDSREPDRGAIQRGTPRISIALQYCMPIQYPMMQNEFSQECPCGSTRFERVVVERCPRAPIVTDFIACLSCRTMLHSPPAWVDSDDKLKRDAAFAARDYRKPGHRKR